MRQGEIVSDFEAPPHPKGISLKGDLVILRPLKARAYSNSFGFIHYLYAQYQRYQI